MKVLGIDPDSHNAGIALNDNGTITHVGVLKINKHKSGFASLKQLAQVAPWYLGQFPPVEVIAIESQEITTTWSVKVSGNSIIQLARACGIILQAALLNNEDSCRVVSTLPKDWKGQVPKRISHMRILDRLGWTYEGSEKVNIFPYVPDGVEIIGNILKSEWTHVIDAIGS